MNTMNPARTQCLLPAILLMCPLVGGGCATHTNRDGGAETAAQAQSTRLDVSGAAPGAVFDAVRETLVDYRFALDRVDALRGVITTRPKRTVGLASPWDREQSGLDQEWEDLLNEQRRVVRVAFDRERDASDYSSLTVSVELVRSHRPGWRLESESIRLSTHARTRNDDGELEPVSFDEVIGMDTRLAERLVEEIEARLSASAASQ